VKELVLWAKYFDCPVGGIVHLNDTDQSDPPRASAYSEKSRAKLSGVHSRCPAVSTVSAQYPKKKPDVVGSRSSIREHSIEQEW
jgi:hypothetical protein